jgi:hypothetical protein
MVTGKVIYRHQDQDKAALMGHVNVNIIGDKPSYPVTIHVSKIKPALKEELHMDIQESLTDLIDSIDSGNHLQAEGIFTSLLQHKIDELLSDAKVEVAQNMFTTSECADCEEEVAEAKKLKDGKGAEKDEEEEEDEDEELDEALKGKQHKIDANKNGKIDAHDFKLLRGKKGVKEENELEEGNAENKAKKNAFVSKVGSQVSKFRERSDKTSGRASMRPQPHNSKIDSRDYQKSGKDAFWKKKGIGTGVHKEEVEQVDEIKKSTLQNYVSKAVVNMSASGFKGDSKKVAKRVKGIGAASAKMKEEVEQIDELKVKLNNDELLTKARKKIGGLAKNYHAAKRASMNKKVSTALKTDSPSDKDIKPMEKAAARYSKLAKGKPAFKEEVDTTSEAYSDPYAAKKAAEMKKAHAATMADAKKEYDAAKKTKFTKNFMKMKKNEEVEQVDEVITKKTPTGEVISDFVHSKNPKFKGKSKKERIKMALGAKYSMMKKGK